jgi:Flp pilus assembly protein TadD
VAIDPSSVEAVQNLGIALIQGGRPAEASRLYEQASRTHPESASICLNLGLAYAAGGDLRAAVSKLREAVDLKPAAVGYLNLGLALSRLGDKESARQNYRRATDLDPGYPEAWNALGAVSISLGDLDEAREALHRALQLRPDYREALYNLCFLPDVSR